MPMGLTTDHVDDGTQYTPRPLPVDLPVKGLRMWISENVRLHGKYNHNLNIHPNICSVGKVICIPNVQVIKQVLFIRD